MLTPPLAESDGLEKEEMMGAGLQRARDAALATRKKKAISWDAFGIINHAGGPWTPRTFDTAADAAEYIKDYKRHYPSSIDLSKHKVVPVRVTVRPI